MFNLNLTKVNIPELKEVKQFRGNYYLAGKDNDFFNDLIYLYENSSIHNSFINNFIQKVYGSGMVGDDEQSQLVIDNMGLNEIFRQVIKDYALYGGFNIETMWGILHTKINQLEYVDLSKVRSGFINEETDEVELYYYSYDWNAYHKNIDIYQSFNTNVNTEDRQLFYYKGNHPGTDIYPRPMYLGGLKYIYTDIELARYYANLVKNNFVGNTIINIPDGGNMEPDKRIEFEKGIKENFTSSENAGSIVVLYGDGEEGVQLLEFGKGSDDQKYQWLSQHTTDQLVITHRIPNPLLAGVRVPGTLGGSQELMDAETIYNNNVIYPARQIVTEVFNELNRFFATPMNSYTINDIPMFNKIEE